VGASPRALPALNCRALRPPVPEHAFIAGRFAPEPPIRETLAGFPKTLPAIDASARITVLLHASVAPRSGLSPCLICKPSVKDYGCFALTYESFVD